MVGNHRTVYYSSFVPSEDLAAVAVDTLLGEPAMLSLIRKLTSSASTRPAPSEGSRKRTIGHLDIFLSLLIPQPEYVMANWDISSATKKFLGKIFLNHKTVHQPHCLQTRSCLGSPWTSQ